MAQKSYPWTNNATGDGTTGGYTAAEWRKIHRYLFGDGVANEGDKLAVSGTASPLAVATGHAVVDGLFYDSTASENLTVTTPVVGTTGGHVILRADYAAQTVRLIAVRNTDGAGGTPSLTQTSETTYEIRLATFTITTGGVVALTDARTFLHYPIRLGYTSVDGGTAQRVPFFDANGQLTASSNLAWDDTNHRLTINSGYAVPLRGRQGGSATDWSSAGSTDQTLTTPRVQIGVVTASFGTSGLTTDVTVTYPVAFSQKPWLTVWLGTWSNSSTYPYLARIFNSSASSVTFRIERGTSGTAVDLGVFWMAIGPE